jgi:hypothetical protein
MIEEVFFAVLASFVPSPSKVYAVVLTESSKLPAVVYAFVGGQSNPTFDTSGLSRYRVEVSSYAKSYVESVRLRNSITTSLNGYTDENMDITKISSFDDFDRETLTFRALAEFYILSVL